MKALLYKEIKLAINPLFGVVSLFGALIFIPQWLYFIALMYIFFITFPNTLLAAKAQNDLGFSLMLPVRKRDVVTARIISYAVLELLNILVVAIVVAVKIIAKAPDNFLMDANLGFIGSALIMYGIFNLVFFPLFYRNANKFGFPLLFASTAAILFAGLVEALLLMSPGVASWLDGTTSSQLISQIPVLLFGMLAFAGLTVLASRISERRFERLDF